MADLTITSSSVAKESGGIGSGTAGATITAGQPVYLDSSVSPATLKPAIATSSAAAAAVGIAINSAASGQPCTYQRDGDINLGSVLTAGQVYVVSATSGKICPVADLVSTNYVTILGIAEDVNTLALGIQPSGVAKA